MKSFLLSRLAERDLDHIKRHLVETAGSRIARRVMKDIRSAADLLGKEPGAGHSREDLTSRPVKFWPIYSYLIIYDPTTKPIQILRVLHGMRDVEDILN